MKIIDKETIEENGMKEELLDNILEGLDISIDNVKAIQDMTVESALNAIAAGVSALKLKEGTSAGRKELHSNICNATNSVEHIHKAAENVAYNLEKIKQVVDSSGVCM